MLVTLLVKFRVKDMKTTELGLLLQVLPVRIIAFVETPGSHLKMKKVVVYMNGIILEKSSCPR